MSTEKKPCNKKRVRDEAKFDYAWMLFSQHINQKEIARKVGIAERTLTRWINKNNWTDRRAAANITRDELVNKTLNLIDKLLQDALEDNNTAQLADKLSKLAGAIKNLDKQANVVDIVQVFMTFNKWLINRQSIDDELTADLLRGINQYQDYFIQERLNHQR